MPYLGIDIGTSAVKAVLVEDGSVVIAEASAPVLTFSPGHGWSEQNPDDWIVAVRQACTTLRQEAGSHWQGTDAIGLSGQMHGAVLLGADQKPLRPCILWNDSRSTGQCDCINAAIDDIETRAGIVAMPGFTAPKVLWCAENEPEIHGRIGHVLLPKDHVRLYLTGTLATDMTDAAGTLWLDQASRAWDDELCSASATDPAWLPTLLEGTAVSGTLREKAAGHLGLPAGIPVSGGGGDAAAGALGIGAIDEGDAFASLGTSGQLFVATRQYRAAPGSFVHCYAHCVPDRWFQMACMLNGASPMQWFANLANRPIGELIARAEGATDAPFFLPYLTGERTPHNDPDIRGSFVGLSPETDDAACMAAVIDAIAYSFCDAQDCLAKAGTELSAIAAIGGGTRSVFVLQTMADAMGVSIHRYGGAQTGPAIGAARTAMVAAGASLADVAKTPPLDRTFQPRAEHRARHVERHARWQQLYRALAPWSAHKEAHS